MHHLYSIINITKEGADESQDIATLNAQSVAFLTRTVTQTIQKARSLTKRPGAFNLSYRNVSSN